MFYLINNNVSIWQCDLDSCASEIVRVTNFLVNVTRSQNLR